EGLLFGEELPLPGFLLAGLVEHPAAVVPVEDLQERLGAILVQGLEMSVLFEGLEGCPLTTPDLLEEIPIVLVGVAELPMRNPHLDEGQISPLALGEQAEELVPLPAVKFLSPGPPPALISPPNIRL